MAENIPITIVAIPQFITRFLFVERQKKHITNNTAKVTAHIIRYVVILLNIVSFEKFLLDVYTTLFP